MTASTTTAKPHGLRLWWWILILGCLISVVLNIWHAVTLETGGKGHPVLGIIFALVPVLFAALLSHGLVSPVVAQWFKWPILALFAIAMLTSISSQAAVLAPYGGGYGGEWSIPVVLDASTLLALNAITSAATKAREAVEEADREAELAAIRADMRPGIEAAVRAEVQSELDAGRAELQAELIASRTELEAEVDRNREAELAAARAEARAELRAKLDAEVGARLEAAEAEFRRQADAEKVALIQQVEVETEARLRQEFAEQAKQQGQRKALPPPSKKTTDDGLTRKDRAKILLAKQPDMNGAELGRALGCTDRYGRDLLKEIQEEDAGTPSPHPALRAVP